MKSYGNGPPRIDILHSFTCSDNNFDVICLSETHLDSSIASDEFVFDVYDIYRRDRDRWGGGVAIMVRSELSALQIDDLVNPNIESIIICQN